MCFIWLATASLLVPGVWQSRMTASTVWEVNMQANGVPGVFSVTNNLRVEDDDKDKKNENKDDKK